MFLGKKWSNQSDNLQNCCQNISPQFVTSFFWYFDYLLSYMAFCSISCQILAFFSRFLWKIAVLSDKRPNISANNQKSKKACYKLWRYILATILENIRLIGPFFPEKHQFSSKFFFQKITRKSEKSAVFWPNFHQFSIFFKNILESDRTH